MAVTHLSSSYLRLHSLSLMLWYCVNGARPTRSTNLRTRKVKAQLRHVRDLIPIPPPCEAETDGRNQNSFVNLPVVHIALLLLLSLSYDSLRSKQTVLPP